MKTNICLVGLNVEYVKNIASLLAAELEMFVADVNELMQFDLINVLEAEKLCGKRYIKGLEKKKVKTVSTFSNTVITMNFNVFNNLSNVKTIKNTSIIVFLNQTKQEYLKGLSLLKTSANEIKIEKSVFFDRVEFLNKNSDVQVQTKKQSPEKVVATIIQELEKYYN